ncbi:MAG: TOBE domain-containing protein, partial [Rhodospirillales bacterium]|nr:TOBE domain-containing protein [Rhodospirillales bacterium]
MNHGIVEQVGTPDEIYNKPRTKFVAGFVGSPEMNFLESKGPIAPGAVSVPINGGEVRVPRLHEGVEHKDIVLGARPEHIYLTDSGDLRGDVFVVEYLGARQMVTVDTPAGRVRVRVPISERVNIGDNVGLGFRSQSLVVFDNKTDQTLQSDLLREAGHG